MPKALIPPKLKDIENLIWGAFWELDTERQVGMSPGPIPGSKIRSYASEFGMTYALFKRIIRSMDGEYLSHLSSKREKVQ